MLRLIRIGLPRAERNDWWRELCSTFAECTPTERPAHALSHLLAAPRTIWTSWVTTRRHAPGSAPGNDDTPP